MLSIRHWRSSRTPPGRPPSRARRSRSRSSRSACSPEILAVVHRGLAEQRRLHLSYYVPARDETTERDVDPMRVSVVEGRSYLEGWCRLADAVRLFRLDRITAATVLDVAGQPTCGGPAARSRGRAVPAGTRRRPGRARRRAGGSLGGRVLPVRVCRTPRRWRRHESACELRTLDGCEGSRCDSVAAVEWSSLPSSPRQSAPTHQPRWRHTPRPACSITAS